MTSMPASTQMFSLNAVRTDGWFERIGESIGGFQTLCEILGERFFAFSLIAGVRIVALTVDRRSVDDTVVEFVAGNHDEEITQRLTLPEFRRKIVGSLLTQESKAPSPTRPNDVQAIQAHIGIRSLLLSPVFNIRLRTLLIHEQGSSLVIEREGYEETLSLQDFTIGLQVLVRQELERVSTHSRDSIDISLVSEAELASSQKDWARVIALLGNWPAPLAIFLRTPEGQNITQETRNVIAKGLGLLGSACAYIGEIQHAEEILRLSIQYAPENTIAGELFCRLGEVFLTNERAGEAIAPLCRASRLGAKGIDVMPLLARAYFARKRYVAAIVCIEKALQAGALTETIALEKQKIEQALGSSWIAWKHSKTSS